MLLSLTCQNLSRICAAVANFITSDVQKDLYSLASSSLPNELITFKTYANECVFSKAISTNGNGIIGRAKSVILSGEQITAQFSARRRFL
jgi:hypothetical protein